MLLLNTNRKSHMENPIALSHLTLSDPKISKPRSLRFGRTIISRKRAELGHVGLLTLIGNHIWGVQYHHHI